MEDIGGPFGTEESREDRMDENQSVCHLCNQKFPAFELEVHFLECQTQDDNGNQQNEPKIVDLTEDLGPDQSPALTNQTYVHIHSMCL